MECLDSFVEVVERVSDPLRDLREKNVLAFERNGIVGVGWVVRDWRCVLHARSRDGFAYGCNDLSVELLPRG